MRFFLSLAFVFSSVLMAEELYDMQTDKPTKISELVEKISFLFDKNVILDPKVTKTIEIISPEKVNKEEAYAIFLSAVQSAGYSVIETGRLIKIIPSKDAIKAETAVYSGDYIPPAVDQTITQVFHLKHMQVMELKSLLAKIMDSSGLIDFRATNTLIVSVNNFQARRIAQFIQLLDVPEKYSITEVISIKNDKASVMASKLTGLGLIDKKKKNIILADDVSNSLIISGPQDFCSKMKIHVATLDIPDNKKSRSVVIKKLEFADAKKVAGTITSLLSQLAPKDEKVNVVADESSNSLILTGSEEGFGAVEKILKALDRKRDLVFLEVSLLEINAEHGFSFGTSEMGVGAQVNNAKVITGWQGMGVAPLVAASALGQQNQTAAIGAAMSPFTDGMNVGVISGSVDVPGVGKISPALTVSMIKSDRYTKILSSPTMLTLDGEESTLEVGEKLFFNVGSVSPSGEKINKVENETASLALTIKPHINSEKMVTLDITLDVSTVIGLSEDGMPRIAKRKMKQNIEMESKLTAFLSGLNTEGEINIQKSIPLLSQIPIIGLFFRQEQKTKTHASIMFLITPYVIYGMSDLQNVLENKRANNKDNKNVFSLNPKQFRN